MTLPHLPVLRHGAPYRSLDTVMLVDHRDRRPLAEVGQANAGLIKRDLARMDKARAALRALPTEQLVAVCARAADLFVSAALPLGGDDGATQTPDEYVACLSATSALPHTLCRANMEKLRAALTSMGAVLNGLTRGLPFAALDEGVAEQAGAPVCYYPFARALGAVLPSNSPGVNSLWLPAIALKTPLALKPGREEPWTPMRLIQALIAAGCPREAFCFYPTDHEGANAVMTGCDRSIIFGDDATIARYAGNPAVQVHGAGRSKVLIGADAVAAWPDYLDVLEASVADNGGRSCVNASTIVVPARGAAIAQALAERLVRRAPRPLDDPNAVLAGFADAELAARIDDAVETGLQTPGAVDLTARLRGGPRRVVVDGTTFLLPTVVHCNSFDHPLANREFLFPFAAVVETPQERMLEQLGPSLVVTAITRDREFQRALLACRQIDRLNFGPVPTSLVRWDQPHEGNLFEFLYRRRAFHQV